MKELPAYFRYWGKADPNYQDEPKWHPLVYHSLDVAAVAMAWWNDSPVVRQLFCSAFGKNEVKNRAWVIFFVALHDIGKFDVRFQLKAPEVLTETWPELAHDDVFLEKYDHGKMGYLLVTNEYTRLFDNSIDFFVLRPWIAAVTGHHGELFDESISGKPYPAAEEYVKKHDCDARLQFIDAMRKIFLEPVDADLAALPNISGSGLTSLLAGFCSIADWIGSNSNKDAFPYRKPLHDPKGYFSKRLVHIQTKGLLKQFGLIRSSLPYAGVQSLLEPGKKSRGVQVKIDSLPVTPSLTLIEAPTGAGKTEAALAYAWRLIEAGYADSIVFALPTQATANAMLIRIEKFAEKLFGKNGANVVLAHGKRSFNHEFQRLVNAGNRTSQRGKDDATVQCAEWLAQSRKRVFLGQIGVCTVDQVLLSVLPVRHKFVRGYGINKSILIVDEIHAYDSYMHGLLAEVIRRQHEVGGSAILLSATLTPALRNEVVATWGGNIVTDNDYPLITHVTNTGALPYKLPRKHLPIPREVQVKCLSLPNAMPNDELLWRILNAAEAGARVAVIVNLVNDAQKIARLLRDPSRNTSSITVDVFHARYRFVDRQKKEELVLSEYGANTKRGSGRILVATQVIEQSLDLDFDWMVTQICPVDLLFQRLGRLHRHEREKQERPSAFGTPKCTVITVKDHNYGLHEEIYKDVRVLWRTEKLLSDSGSFIRFPEAYRKWINRSYERTTWDDEPDIIIGKHSAYVQYQEFKATEARNLVTMTMSQFRDDNEGITSLTRDGEMSLTVLPFLSGKRFLDGDKPITIDEKAYNEARNLNCIPVPASWGKLLHSCQKDDDGRYMIEFTPESKNTRVSHVGRTVFRYSKDFGLEKV